MRKLKLYFDTSVLNFIFEEKDIAKRDATQELFREIKSSKFEEVFISAMVIREIEAASKDKREKLFGLVKEYRFKVLELNVEIEELAGKYVARGVIPERYSEDAIHIAVAVVNNLDVIISWNLKHMVKVKTRLEVNGINRLEGYKEIEISNPEEVIENV